MSAGLKESGRRGLSVARKGLLSGQSLSHVQSRPKTCPSTPVPECKPCCIIKRPPKPPCHTPKQPVWECCDRLCLPCCEKICIPQNCKGYTIGLAVSKKEEYHLPAFSECLKEQRHICGPRECCYTYTKCHHSGPLSEIEVRPLITIRERQRMALNTFTK